MDIISSALPSSIYINYPKVVITQKLSLLEFLLMGGGGGVEEMEVSEMRGIEEIACGNSIQGLIKKRSEVSRG